MSFHTPTDNYRHRLLPLRQQLEVQNGWLRERLDTVIPAIMAREKMDMWVIIAREYNDDPVMPTLLPQPEMGARRRTMLLFCRNADGSVDRLTLARYGYGDFYRPAWNPEEDGDQYACLVRHIRERNPQTIGINLSREFAFGDGLSQTEFVQLADGLGAELMGRTRSAERLCLGWLETRIPAELTAYLGLVEMGHSLIAEAFSTRVIHPGITTTDDVVWWMRQRMQEMGLRAWFQPSVEIQAPGQGLGMPNEKAKEPRRLILPGDVLHCDVGFHYLGLATDQQQHAYVLKPRETDAPAGLKAALADGNQLQDFHMAAMQVGRTGNQVLAETLTQAHAAGLLPQVYSHPLGYHGHAAGPTIGLWDQQGGVPGRGDYELFDETCYSIELNVRKAVPEWGGQEVRIALEEDAVLSGGEMRWLNGRQTAFHLVG